MIFHETTLPGAWIVDLEPFVDERGFFARTWCSREFEKRNLDAKLVQCSVSYNLKRGTLRGLHFQVPPSSEAKLVRCTAGAIWDVIVDVRAESRNLHIWQNIELSAANHRMIFVPPGVAHGFQTLEDDTEVLYQMTEYYNPDCDRGLAWDDPSIGIRWPIENPILSKRDQAFQYLPIRQTPGRLC